MRREKKNYKTKLIKRDNKVILSLIFLKLIDKKGRVNFKRDFPEKNEQAKF